VEIIEIVGLLDSTTTLVFSIVVLWRVLDLVQRFGDGMKSILSEVIRAFSKTTGDGE